MAKKKRRKAAAPRPLTKKQRSRAEREARMNRWIIAGAVTVGVVVVAILAYGYLVEEVFKAREPVATVGGVVITTADFETRVRYHRVSLQQELNRYMAQRMALDPTDPEAAPLFDQLDEVIRRLEAQLAPEYAPVLGGQVLDQMVQEELIRQEAARRGIMVSQEEIDRAIEQQFGYDRDGSAGGAVPPLSGPVTATQPTTPTGSLTREEFEQNYQAYVEAVLEPSGLGEEGFRALAEVSLLYDKVREAIVSGIPTLMDQVQARYIAFPSEEEAAQVVERLDAGEAWEDIVAEIEADEESAAFASELDWRTEAFVTEQFGAEISQAVFDAPVGSYTQPLLGVSGRYYVIQVLGHEERELDPLMRAFERDRAFREWFNLQRQGVEYADDWQEKVPTRP
jgi:parvulin-like peptidyl-prolyl isomerase